MARTKETQGYVYHIQDPEHIGSLEHGYVGVVTRKKGVYRRFLDHRSGKSEIGHRIRLTKLTFDEHVQTLFEGSLDDCYKKEKELRPKQKLGWNIASGGKGWNYKSNILELSEHRSKIQKERMTSSELKRQQGEAFKKRYYTDPQMQQLRKLRATEHMADPEKRQSCLSALHGKAKCPLCEYTGNHGNVAQHMKKVHNEAC